MKKLGCALIFLLSTSAMAEQWNANDPRLKIDPTLTNNSYSDSMSYIEHAGLDKLTNDIEFNLPQVVDKMVNDMVVTGVNELYNQGLNDDGARLLRIYNEKIQGKIIDSYDIGDHKPWSEALLIIYQELVILLGQDRVNALHLDDIWYIDYAIPVVFHPKDPTWDIVEYRKHFVPLAEAITYWVTDIACDAITYGSGWFMICTPIATVCEKVMTNYISPRLSDRIYKRANGL